ncbi:Six-hairpin glycosidase [Rhodotorula diobovata]|uniref:Six-hairpin glycosidase n=1 Tax=Rhodotorula diobovata TaxID=5288 RepID=A0A5C5FZS6_9BASI|nr:Six-hairpin glycosidase [Rhodotorula diobovata]
MRCSCGLAGAVTAVVGALAVRAAPLKRSDSSPLPDDAVALIKQRLIESATDTWTSGTYVEALLELDYPELSVFSSSSGTYPPPSSASPPYEVESIVASWASKRPSWTKELAYENGGAAADPAALGVGWLVAAAFADDDTKAVYLAQARQEVNYLLNSVPRTGDGAISHRPPGESPSLWADYVSMVPPFLAYYGVATSDRSLVAQAYTQIKLYRAHLQSSSSGSWKHVVGGGSFEDAGLWNTGNGWAAHGIVRVLATMQASPWSESFANEKTDLADWATEILTSAFSHLKSDSLLPNYYDAASSSYFSDASGSALLAAAAYRLAQVSGTSSEYLVETASTIRSAVNGKINQSTGWVSPVVNPLSFKAQSSASPEAEAFLLLLEAAWRDYYSSIASSS